MDISNTTQQIPTETKKNMIEFNENEAIKIFERLEELRMLKQTQKEAILNTRYNLHTIDKGIKQIDKIKTFAEQDNPEGDSLKKKLGTLFNQLDEFNKGVNNNNKVLDTLALQIDRSKDMIEKLNKMR